MAQNSQDTVFVLESIGLSESLSSFEVLQLVDLSHLK